MSLCLRLFIRLLSVMLVFSFGLEQIVLAVPTTLASQVTQPVGKISIAEIIKDPSRLSIPYDHVTLKEIHKGNNGKLIIHIQDPHANYSGQMSVANALDYFFNHYDLSLVFTEGSAKDSTLTELRELAPLDDWKRSSKKFLAQGVIDGVEYLNLTTDHSMKILGIEYKDLYEENVAVYAMLKDKRTRILNYLHRIKSSLQRVKNKLYPKELIEYEDRTKSSSISGEINVQDRIKLLMNMSDEINFREYPEVRKLQKLQAVETSIDFKKASEQQQILLTQLSSNNGNQDLNHHVANLKKSSNNNLVQASTLNQILNLAEMYGLNVSEFKELSLYVNYLRKFSELSTEELHDEIESLEKYVYQKHLFDEDLKKIRAIEQYIAYLEKAYQIQLSSDEFVTLKASYPDFSTVPWQAFLNRKLEELGYYEDLVIYDPILDESRAYVEHFYSIVRERDDAFIENTNRWINESNDNIGILVTGGYHTANLTRLLKIQGYSYVVLTPLVLHETDRANYEKLLLSLVTLRNMYTLDLPAAAARMSSLDLLISTVSPNRRQFALTVSDHIFKRPNNERLNDSSARNHLRNNVLRNQEVSNDLNLITRTTTSGSRMAFDDQVKKVTKERLAGHMRESGSDPHSFYGRVIQEHFFVDAVLDFVVFGIANSFNDESEHEFRRSQSTLYYSRILDHPEVWSDFLNFLKEYKVQMTDINRHTALFTAAANFLKNSPRPDIRILILGIAEKYGRNQKADYLRKILESNLDYTFNLEIVGTDVYYNSTVYSYDEMLRQFSKVDIFNFDHSGQWRNPTNQALYQKITPGDPARDITSSSLTYDASNKFDVVISSKIFGPFGADGYANIKTNGMEHVSQNGLFVDYGAGTGTTIELYHKDIHGVIHHTGSINNVDDAKTNLLPFDLPAVAQRVELDSASPITLDIRSIPNGTLHDVLATLRELNIDDVVVAGGAVRDTFLGHNPTDVDVAVKVPLREDLLPAFENDLKELTPEELNRKYQLSYRAESVAIKALKRMGIPAKKLYKEKSFQGYKTDFTFSAVVVGNYLINLSNRRTFTVDQIAIDGNGRIFQLYGNTSIQDLMDRVVRYPNDATGHGLINEIRAIRLKHQYGFSIQDLRLEQPIIDHSINQMFFKHLRSTAKKVLVEIVGAVQTPSLAPAYLRAAKRHIRYFIRMESGVKWAEYHVRKIESALKAISSNKSHSTVNAFWNELNDRGVLRMYRLQHARPLLNLLEQTFINKKDGDDSKSAGSRMSQIDHKVFEQIIHVISNQEESDDNRISAIERFKTVIYIVDPLSSGQKASALSAFEQILFERTADDRLVLLAAEMAGLIGFEAEPILIKLLRDRDAFRRYAASSGFVRLTQTVERGQLVQSMPHLVNALETNKDNNVVLVNITESLGNHGITQTLSRSLAIGSLKKHLNNPMQEVRHASAYALSQLGVDTEQLLGNFINHTKPEYRMSVLGGVIKSLERDPSAQPARQLIVAAIDSPYDDVRNIATRTIHDAKLNMMDPANEQIDRAFNDLKEASAIKAIGNTDKKRQAIHQPEALGQGNQKAIQALIEVAENRLENNSIRVKAINALVHLANEGTLNHEAPPFEVVGNAISPNGGHITISNDPSGEFKSFSDEVSKQAHQATEGGALQSSRNLISMTHGRILYVPPLDSDEQRSVLDRVRELADQYESEWKRNLEKQTKDTLTLPGINFVHEAQWLITRGKEDTHYPLKAGARLTSASASLLSENLEFDELLPQHQLKLAIRTLQDEKDRFHFFRRSGLQKIPITVELRDEHKSFAAVLDRNESDEFILHNGGADYYEVIADDATEDSSAPEIVNHEFLMLQADMDYHAQGILSLIGSNPSKTYLVAVDQADHGNRAFQTVMSALLDRLALLPNVRMRIDNSADLRQWIDSLNPADYENLVVIGGKESIHSQYAYLGSEIMRAAIGIKANDYPAEEKTIDALGVAHLVLAMVNRDYNRVQSIYERVTGSRLTSMADYFKLLAGRLTIYPKLRRILVDLDRIRELAREALTSV